MLADRSPCTEKPNIVVANAARVLSAWPENFFRLLNDLNHGVAVQKRGGIRAHFSALYTSLFKCRSSRDAKGLIFLKNAFLEYATKHWKGGRVDEKLLGARPECQSRRYLSVYDFAAQFRVQPATAARYLNHHPASFRVASGRSTRLLLDSQAISACRTTPGTVVRAREAARSLGISVELLKHLRKIGLFEVNHLFPTKSGYHERDISVFRQKLLALSSSGTESDPLGDTITLAQAIKNRHDPAQLKGEIFRALFNKELTIAALRNQQADGILIYKAQLQAFIRVARERLSAGISASEAAAELLCDAGAIPYFLRHGHLAGIETPVGIRISRDSIKLFKQQWVSLASLAKHWHTSSRALLSKCHANGITPLLVPVRKGKSPLQPFIPADHAETLYRALRNLELMLVWTDSATSRGFQTVPEVVQI
jgi:hypothetical protein